MEEECKDSMSEGRVRERHRHERDTQREMLQKYRGVERHLHAQSTESMCGGFICFLKVGIFREVSWEDLIRMFTSLPGVIFQSPGLYCFVYTRVGGH